MGDLSNFSINVQDVNLGKLYYGWGKKQIYKLRVAGFGIGKSCKFKKI